MCYMVICSGVLGVFVINRNLVVVCCIAVYASR